MARTPAILLACLALFAGAFATPLVNPPERGELVLFFDQSRGAEMVAHRGGTAAGSRRRLPQQCLLHRSKATFAVSSMTNSCPCTPCALQDMLMAAPALADLSSASSTLATTAAAALTATSARLTVSAHRLHTATAGSGSVMSAALLNSTVHQCANTHSSSCRRVRSNTTCPASVPLCMQTAAAATPSAGSASSAVRRMWRCELHAGACHWLCLLADAARRPLPWLTFISLQSLHTGRKLMATAVASSTADASNGGTAISNSNAQASGHGVAVANSNAQAAGHGAVAVSDANAQ